MEKLKIPELLSSNLSPLTAPPCVSVDHRQHPRQQDSTGEDVDVKILNIGNQRLSIPSAPLPGSSNPAVMFMDDTTIISLIQDSHTTERLRR